MSRMLLGVAVACGRAAALTAMLTLASIGGGWAQSGLDARPSSATCRAGDAPGTGAVTLQRVWPELGSFSPFELRPTPNTTNEYYVIARNGRMYRFVPGQTPVLVLDVNASVGSADYSTDPGRAYEPEGSEHWGLVSFDFHPNFSQNGQIFILYNGRQANEAYPTSYVERYTMQADGTFASKLPIFSLPQPNHTVLHHLGHIAFGPDGFLYISSGDSTENGWDPNVSPPPSQKLDSFYGKILRLDIDHAWPGLNYAIPWNNPWIGVPGTRWEVWALGLRNPWRFSFDKATGRLWLGDVGYASYEEVDIIEWGGNYGWPVIEANTCVWPNWVNPATGTPCTTAIPDSRPAAQFFHGGAYMGVIGGHVYRGFEMPSLIGKYVFGLYGPNIIYSLDPSNNRVETLLDNTPQITSFFTDAQNELYAVASWEGNVYKLTAGAGSGDAGIPQLLSQTGCVRPDNPQVAQGMIPFAVNSQLWSDGASKERFIAVPDGEHITVNPDGDFSFPVGTVLMKTFMFNGVPFETRFLKHHSHASWAGYTYRWQGGDARLVDRGGEDVVVINNAGTPINWHYPSRGQCLLCHTQAAGVVLGPEIAQLNSMFHYPSTGITGNQLQTWDHIGMFEEALPFDRPALADYDNGGLPITDRARSYLHSNCAGCHRSENNSIRATMDLKFFTPVAQANICGVDPNISNLGVAGAKLVTPGNPALSILPMRMRVRGENQMPPLGTQYQHTGGINVIESWIGQMDAACN